MLSNKVVSGKWYDPYSDRNLYDADEVEIDHIVPLSWAWAHGASCWSREKRREFHNDQKFLVPMAASLNSKKGAKIPGEWSPPVTRARCGYIIKFARAVRIYGFDIPQSERDRLNRVGKDWCGERFSTTFLDAGS
ncbi:GmrSD restriction endonuclease domain-containing protein [Litoreibacter meonggei]